MIKAVLRVPVHTVCPCPYCMSMSMLHVHVHTACPCPYCMSMSMLDGHVNAACPCQYPCTYIKTCRTDRHPVSPVLKKLTMPEQVRYRTKLTLSCIFLVRYRTKIRDAEKPMPTFFSSIPMPSYICCLGSIGLLAWVMPYFHEQDSLTLLTRHLWIRPRQRKWFGFPKWDWLTNLFHIHI
jgi:hypothetical protein